MTKLYGTLGPSCGNAEILCEMINVGMTGIRLNLSHGDIDSFKGYLDELNKAEEICGKKVELVIDMEGPEMRVGKVSKPLVLLEQELIVLGDDIPLDESILAQLEKGLVCRLDDGKIELLVQEKIENGYLCLVKRGGTLLPRKSFAVIGKNFTRPVLTERDIRNICNARMYGISAVLQPFVHSSNDVNEVKKALIEHGCPEVAVMAKIEDEMGVNNMDEIVASSDYVVFARGDLGNNMDMWKVPKIQKRLAVVCRNLGKPFIVATQLLASMEKNPTPTRAEMNDIFNCVVDGACGLMLTGETAAGNYPAKAIYFLGKAAAEGASY